MHIAVGCDHAGFVMKKEVLQILQGLDIDITDCGTDSPESVDYPDLAKKVAELVSSGKADRGILICGTGLGMSMAANKYPNVRAALCNDLFTAEMSRRHNDANVLAIGGRILGTDLAREIVSVWLNTPFEGGRHLRRIQKITPGVKDAETH